MCQNQDGLYVETGMGDIKNPTIIIYGGINVMLLPEAKRGNSLLV